MGVVANEPSMEEILSSIKRIIGEGADEKPGRLTRRRAQGSEDAALSAEGVEDDAKEADIGAVPGVLELTERAEAGLASAEPAPAGEKAESSTAPILSDSSAAAARIALSHLSSLLVKPQDGESATLEGLVREMLRPMLKDWLDARLPELVEMMVRKEIDRIVGRLG